MPHKSQYNYSNQNSMNGSRGSRESMNGGDQRGHTEWQAAIQEVTAQTGVNAASAAQILSPYWVSEDEARRNGGQSGLQGSIEEVISDSELSPDEGFQGGSPRAGSYRAGSPRAGSYRSRNGSHGGNSQGSNNGSSNGARAGSYRAGSPRAGSYRAGSPRAGSYRAGSPRAGSYRGSRGGNSSSGSSDEGDMFDRRGHTEWQAAIQDVTEQTGVGATEAAQMLAPYWVSENDARRNGGQAGLQVSIEDVIAESGFNNGSQGGNSRAGSYRSRNGSHGGNSQGSNNGSNNGSRAGSYRGSRAGSYRSRGDQRGHTEWQAAIQEITQQTGVNAASAAQMLDPYWLSEEEARQTGQQAGLQGSIDDVISGSGNSRAGSYRSRGSNNGNSRAGSNNGSNNGSRAGSYRSRGSMYGGDQRGHTEWQAAIQDVTEQTGVGATEAAQMLAPYWVSEEEARQTGQQAGLQGSIDDVISGSGNSRAGSYRGSRNGGNSQGSNNGSSNGSRAGSYRGSNGGSQGSRAGSNGGSQGSRAGSNGGSSNGSSNGGSRAGSCRRCVSPRAGSYQTYSMGSPRAGSYRAGSPRAGSYRAGSPRAGSYRGGHMGEKIVNPETGSWIEPGKSTFNRLVRNGYVYQNGQLMPEF